MRQVSLREFRTRGAKALVDVPQGETTLLVGQNGPAFFLVPVFGDVTREDQELRRAMALASLREGWRLAEASGANLASEEEIEIEIDRIRRSPEGEERRCAS
jgi:antitoxin (DNA-binding transcriptional repressor) of toxin-antitoxin stability system